MCGGGTIPVDGSAIVSALAERDRLDARIAEAVGAFDAEGRWDLDHATSMVAWLRDRGGRTSKEAGRIAGRAKALRSLPVTAAAWASGQLGGGQVDAILAKLDRRTRDHFAEHEAELVPVLAPLSVADTVVAMAVWAARARAEADEPEPDEPERSLQASRTLDGRMILDGDLDANTANTVEAALRLAVRPDDEGEARRA